MQYTIKQTGKFKYVEEGQGESLVLLHGLFGALSNFKDLIEFFKKQYTVYIPMLPLYDLTNFDTSVAGLAKHVAKFIEVKNLKKYSFARQFTWRSYSFSVCPFSP